jgi:hypothetical protein
MAKLLYEFEIFYDLGEGLEPCQVAAVLGLENAKAMMEQLATEMPGRYFVWNSLEGEVMAHIDSTSAPRCRNFGAS